MEPLQDVRVGMTGREEVVVTPERTVGGRVPGMPMVFSTPEMIMAMEIAALNAVKPHLPDGWVAVGSEVDIRHLAPTAVGRTVVATAVVTAVEGRSVSFSIEAHDGERKIGDGFHKRGAVNLARFAERTPGS